MNDFIDKDAETFEASSPGRMDVMGGIADYSGSLVLQRSIKEKTTVWFQPDRSSFIRIASAAEGFPVVEYDLNAFKQEGQYDYAAVRAYANSIEKGSWSLYVIGCFLVLANDKGVALKGGKVLVDSRVPVGKGVSSSAALEVATLKAICAAGGLQFSGTELPILAQRVENHVVGAACGLMDQLASYFGNENHLLPIVCQPDAIDELVAIPSDLGFVGIDSGVTHAVSGASYGDVRTAAFMGYTIIAMQEGATQADIVAAKRSGDFSKLPFGGYLSNIAPSVFESKYAHLLPISMQGEVFQEKYGEISDPITTVDASTDFAVYQASRHPIYENYRVQQFKLILSDYPQLKDSASAKMLLGEMMYQSHASYSQCRLGNAQTDRLVALAREMGSDNGVYGAKITGGGSGGTVCFLIDRDKGDSSILALKKKYEEEVGKEVTIFF